MYMEVAVNMTTVLGMRAKINWQQIEVTWQDAFTGDKRGYSLLDLTSQ